MDNNSEVVYLYLDDIIPNRFQPREVFDDQALKELAVSIKEHGVIQPIIVRKVENKYEIIAGERRYKASTMAGLAKIPAIVKNLDDKESSKVALIENLQRKDLSPIEEARTYQKILELEDDMTQEQLAATMGKTQSSVSNKLRLLALPDEVQDALLKDKISERHARSLLNIEDKNEQIKMMDRIINEKMTVRDLDKEIKILKGEPVEEITINDHVNEVVQSAPSENKTSFIPPVEEKKDDSLSASDILNEDKPQENDNNSINEAFAAIKKSLEEARSEASEKTEPATEAAIKEAPPGFRFVPSFGMDLLNNITQEEKTTESNNVASSLDYDMLTVSNEAKDITNALVDIRGTVDKLKEDGYNITLDESEEGNKYKIVINIDKDA